MQAIEQRYECRVYAMHAYGHCVLYCLSGRGRQSSRYGNGEDASGDVVWIGSEEMDWVEKGSVWSWV